MYRREFALTLLSLGGVAMIGACAPYGPGPGAGYGPPPHAPAHGYRHRLPDGVELVFDAGLGLYVVVGYPSHYYVGGRFYRFHDGYWLVGPAVAGPWGPAPAASLPPGLQKKGPGAVPPGHRRRS